MFRIVAVAALAAVAMANTKEDLLNTKPTADFFVPSHCARTARWVSHADNTNKPGHQTMELPADTLRYRIMWFKEERKEQEDPTKKWSRWFFPGAEKPDHKGNLPYRYMSDHVYEVETCLRACRKTVLSSWRKAGGSNDLAEDVAGLQRADNPWSTLGLWNGNKAHNSKLDSIAMYRIKWYNTDKSQWFVPGKGDIDWKRNDYKPYYRRAFSYFEDHSHQVATCDSTGRCKTVKHTKHEPLCASTSGGCVDKVAAFIAKHKVVRYAIKWFNDGWSPFFTVGVDDKDHTGKYPEGTRVSLYMSDHEFKYEACTA